MSLKRGNVTPLPGLKAAEDTEKHSDKDSYLINASLRAYYAPRGC